MTGPLPDFPRCKNPSIAVAMPVRRSVHPATMVDVLRVIQTIDDMGWPVTFFNVTGTHVHKARNMIVNHLLHPLHRQRHTHVLMIDADMAVRPDIALRLAAAEMPIVGATAVRGQAPRNPCAWIYGRTPHGVIDPNDYKFKETWDAIDDARFNRYPATLEVDAIGTGVVLIDLRVFHRIPEPWFFYDENNDAMTSDVYFCLKAKRAGIPVVLDAGCEVGHLHLHAFDMAHFRANRDEYEAMISLAGDYGGTKTQPG